VTKALSAGMVTHLALDVTTLASCIEMILENGTVHRFTDHPADIVFGGDTYLASVGHEASDPVARNDLAVDGLELTLLIDSPGLSEAELIAGLYDYADFKLFLVEYTDPDTNGDIKIMKGRLGEVGTSKGATATVELRGLTQHLQKGIGEKYSADCPVELSDPRCGIIVAPSVWPASSAIALGQSVSPSSANGRQFVATRAGLSGATEPAWNLTIGGVTDEPALSTGTTSDIADGTTTGGASDTEVIDTTATFIEHGVRAGDVIRNVTDGSEATVITVIGETNLQTQVLAGGFDRLWETGDTYSIDLAQAVNDSGATFQTDGVIVGDTVRNTTDGSTASVLVVNSETKLTIAGLTGGTVDAFAVGDAYSVDGAGWTTRDAFTKPGTVTSVTDRANFVADGAGVTSRGTTTGASDLVLLIDSTATFQTDGVGVSDVVNNTTDGSIGNVVSVDSEIQVTTSTLVGGVENDWDTGDVYAITEGKQIATGTHTGVADSATVLTDSEATFIATSNVKVGNVVRNTTDGSTGTVVTIDSETQITTSALVDGTDNDFDVDDAYTIEQSINDAGSWQYGVVTWVTGANAGLSMEVKSSSQIGAFELFLPMGFVIANGDTFTVETGCAKTFNDCKFKFDNVINFQGFPYVPAPDTILKVGGQ